MPQFHVCFQSVGVELAIIQEEEFEARLDAQHHALGKDVGRVGDVLVEFREVVQNVCYPRVVLGPPP